jgi:hypothetical protein
VETNEIKDNREKIRGEKSWSRGQDELVGSEAMS